MEEYSKNKTCGAVIAAAGSGKRFGAAKSKLLAELGNIPVFIYAVKNFLETVSEKKLMIAAPEKLIPEFRNALKKHLPGKAVKIIPGGKTRMESVYKALSALPGEVETVAIHDAARPFTAPELIFECFRTCDKHGSAVSAKPVSDTLKETGKDGFVIKTVDRSSLCQVETPQVFSLSPLLEAYEKAMKEEKFFTDDAGVMEYAGHKVYLLENTAFNLKITYPADLLVAEAFLKSGKR